MRFAILSGVPYLVANGKAYPVEISGDTVTYYEEGAQDFDGSGALSIDEVRAKFGSEIKRKQKRRKKAEE